MNAGSALDAASLFACTYWWFASRRLVRAMRAVRLLGEVEAPEPSRWPKVSLIVPACNEADTLERAVASRLDDDYPNLEVVLVDDRSTDATGAIIDAIAAKDPRVMAVHITELPPGWLGKVHALERGVKQASGEFLLFSDADVTFAPGTLRRAVSYAVARSLDHLAAFPKFLEGGLVLDAAVDAFGSVFVAGIDLASVENPRSRAAVGGGVFALVRRSMYDKTRGFEWLRMEVADDVALGQMLKDAGGRASIVNGQEYLSLHWYRSFGEMSRGLEKNFFAILGRYRLSILVALCALMLWFLVGPIVGFAWAALWVKVICAASLMVGLSAQVVMNRWLGRRIGPALLSPLGALLLIGVALKSGLVAVWRGGVVWRGTLYRTKDLREGMRLRWP